MIETIRVGNITALGARPSAATSRPVLFVHGYFVDGSIWNGWLDWVRDEKLGSSCLFVSGAVEYDDRPGPVRDTVLAGLAEWRRQLARTVRQSVEEGHLRTDTDPDQVAFELCSIILGVHNDIRLFRDTRAFTHARAAFDRLLANFVVAG